MAWRVRSTHFSKVTLEKVVEQVYLIFAQSCKTGSTTSQVVSNSKCLTVNLFKRRFKSPYGN